VEQAGEHRVPAIPSPTPRAEGDRQGVFEVCRMHRRRGEVRRLSAVREVASSYGVRSCQQRYTIRIHVKANARRAAW
jgi:hypothetical protein